MGVVLVMYETPVMATCNYHIASSQAKLQHLLVQDATGAYRVADDDYVVEAARKVLERQFRPGLSLTSPSNAKEYLQLKLAFLEHEVFATIWLDSQHRVIAYEELFRGTIDSAVVHSREVVKAALQHNAAAVIFVHNHPSGASAPSDADKQITKRLVDALGLIDLRVIDHMIVAGSDVLSFAEERLL